MIPTSNPLQRKWTSFLEAWETPLFAACMAITVYSLFALLEGPLWRETKGNYFSYLADAFLHGQLYLRSIPPSVHDLVYFHGNYYLYWPAFPAVFLIPLVLIFGIHISDVLVVLILSGASVGVVAQVLRAANQAGVAPLDRSRRGLLVLFFALGTVILPLAPFGTVWSLSQLLVFLLIGLAYMSALSLMGWKAFFFTGLFLALATLTRSHTIFIGIWPAYYLLKKHWPDGLGKILAYSVTGGIPVIFAIGLTLLYNYGRFGDVTQVGYDYHNMADIFVENYKLYGPFNLFYLPTNLYYQYIYYPFPWRKDSFMGGSLFLLSPILFSIFPVFFKKFKQPSVLFLSMSIFLVNIPILLLMGTGWVQFGPRYTLDFTLPLLLLVAMGIKDWRLSILQLLVAISCFQYFLGTYIKSRLT